MGKQIKRVSTKATDMSSLVIVRAICALVQQILSTSVVGTLAIRCELY